MEKVEERNNEERRRAWRPILADLLVLGFLVVFILPGLLESVIGRGGDFEEPVPRHVEKHLTFIEGHLQKDFEGYSFYQVLAPQFDIIALSHMASGLMNLSVADQERREIFAPLTEELVQRGIQASPYESSPEVARSLGDHNLYHSHLNLILGIHRYISGDEQYDEVHERISRHLRSRSLAGGDFHAISYHGYPQGKWPADQSVTLASLYLYDQIHDTSLSQRPIEGWLKVMESRSDSSLGLHHSVMTPGLWAAEVPRGCALSWTVFYMAQFAPEEARVLYENYREHYAGFVLGWGGFREWPPDESHGMNVNSGPILFGLGMAATGLGVGAARIFEDEPMYTGIMRSASTFGLPSTGVVGGRRHRSSPVIGEAMLFSGVTARRWFGELPQEPLPEKELPAPIGALLSLLVVLTFIGLLVAHIRKLWKGRLDYERSDSSSSSA